MAAKKTKSLKVGRASRKRGFWLGLTGSLASGKTTALKAFQKLGWRTQSADQVVADLYKEKGLTKEALLKKFGANRAGLRKLEKWIHPQVKKRTLKFLKASAKPAVVEVPLMFEAKFDREFDACLFIHSPLPARRRRAIKRGMKPKLFDFLNAQQFSDEKKIKLADFVLQNDSKKIMKHEIKVLSGILLNK